MKAPREFEIGHVEINPAVALSRLDIADGGVIKNFDSNEE